MRTSGLFALGLAVVLWALVAGLAQQQSGSVADDELTASSTPTEEPSETLTPSPTPTPSEVPTRFIALPFLRNEPSPTPLPTATNTQTPTPTQTSTPANTPLPQPTSVLPPINGNPIAGTFFMLENKPTYATWIENIKYLKSIQNVTGANVTYGVLGVNVEGPRTFFKTSWSGELAPGGVLLIEAGCYGPAGGTCAPNVNEGRVEDSIIVDAPGTYRLALYICLSNHALCTSSSGGGDWRLIAPPINIVAVDWTPQPPAMDGYVYDPKPICVMDLSNPDNIILTCRTVGKRHAPEGGKG